MPLSRLYVDFNSFFASVEQQERPELRDRPVAVVPVMADTSCCIAASYEARRSGVKTGTLVGEAKRLCPQIVLVEAHHESYVHYHRRLIQTIDTVVPVLEVRSIDEVLCELPGRWRSEEWARDKALEVKRAVANMAPYIKCSIGIASNLFLAKTASDMQKPDGLTLLRDTDLPQALYRLALRDLYGIGPSMETRLKHSGIHTVEQLCNASREQLHKAWGSVGGDLFHARLHGAEPVLPPEQTGSIGHSHVLPPAQRNPEDARAVLHRLLQKAAVRLRKAGYAAGGLVSHQRFVGGGRWDEEARFSETQDTLELTHALNAMLDRRPAAARRKQPLKVGVTLIRLIRAEGQTEDLFRSGRSRERLNTAVDRLNRRFGKNAVWFGAASRALASAPMRIAFNRIPDIETER
ncbi:MAG: DUF4113 domain-containing protein [Nevskiales bacterium]|nr:DUF4113 domain-containing protein [Nevskiales bacterium]